MYTSALHIQLHHNSTRPKQTVHSTSMGNLPKTIVHTDYQQRTQYNRLATYIDADCAATIYAHPRILFMANGTK